MPDAGREEAGDLARHGGEAAVAATWPPGPTADRRPRPHARPNSRAWGQASTRCPIPWPAR
eukprot:2534060-Alexandrium_andersonii.AAC.1